MKTKHNPTLSPKVWAAMIEFVEQVNPHTTMSALLELMRMVGQSDMMKESDPAAEEIWQSLYYINNLLRAMQEADLERLRKGAH